jgi:hypothetical protein
MAKLKDLKVSIGLSKKGMGQLNKDLRQVKAKFRNKFGEVGAMAQNFGRNMTLGVTAPLAMMGVQAVKAFDQQAKAIAQVEAGLKSTAGQVGYTSQQLQQMASDLQQKTLFGDEVILKDATAQLLTFTNISGDQFARTQKAALDLATRLDGDLKGASIQLGKALNDPIANLSALSRSGIQFSADQKEVIKSLTETGRLAEAQTIILDELEKQYGGSAEAAAKAGMGPFKQLSNTLGDLSEEFGKLINDMIVPLVPHVQRLVKVGWADGFVCRPIVTSAFSYGSAEPNHVHESFGCCRRWYHATYRRHGRAKEEHEDHAGGDGELHTADQGAGEGATDTCVEHQAASAGGRAGQCQEGQGRRGSRSTGRRCR